MQNPVRNRFLNKLHTEELGGGRARLTSDLHYVAPSGERIVVPKGFETDFASVPSLARASVIIMLLVRLFYFLLKLSVRFAWLETAVDISALMVIFMAEWLENRDSDMAAVVHDWLYSKQDHWRWQCDLILFHALDAHGAPTNPPWKRVLFFVNVRLFGWWPWYEDDQKNRWRAFDEDRKRLASKNAA